MFGTIEVPDQFYDYDKKDEATSNIKHVAHRPCDSALVGQETPANAARNDGEPGSEDPAPIKMSNTKLGQACSEELAPTKLNEQDNTHAEPVRAPGSALIAGILYMKALYISIPPSLYIAAFLLVYI